jgi:hypothetical protein
MILQAGAALLQQKYDTYSQCYGSFLCFSNVVMILYKYCFFKKAEKYISYLSLKNIKAENNIYIRPEEQ